MTEPLYSFHPLADKKQDEIWFYTYQKWGLEQADKYIDGLHAVLETVALDLKHPKVRSLPSETAAGHFGKHYLFFCLAAENVPERIQVLTILHDSMDIPARVKEDLVLLEQTEGDDLIHEQDASYLD